MKEFETRLAEVERVQDLMRTVINDLGSQIHDLVDAADEVSSLYFPPLPTDENPNEGETINEMLERVTNHDDFEEDWEPSSFLDAISGTSLEEADVFETHSSTPEEALEAAKNLLGGMCEMLGIPVEEQEVRLELDEAATVSQVEVWQCPEGNHHVALRFENGELEALADYDDEEVWNAREYAQAFAYRENLALYDRTAEGPVDQ